jgi:adenine-specific DNA methylase
MAPAPDEQHAYLSAGFIFSADSSSPEATLSTNYMKRLKNRRAILSPIISVRDVLNNASVLDGFRRPLQKIKQKKSKMQQGKKKTRSNTTRRL